MVKSHINHHTVKKNNNNNTCLMVKSTITGWWYTYPSEKNMSSSVGMMILPKYSQYMEKNMFQTTNQNLAWSYSTIKMVT